MIQRTISILIPAVLLDNQPYQSDQKAPELQGKNPEKK